MLRWSFYLSFFLCFWRSSDLFFHLFYYIISCGYEYFPGIKAYLKN